VGPHDFCAALASLAGARPAYLAVVSRRDAQESVAWALKLPIPHLVYSYSSSSSDGTQFTPYLVAQHRGAPSSAYTQFVIDHYGCLPRWTLFLHKSSSSTSVAAAGRGGGMGGGGGGGGYHPLDPASSSALIDVHRLDRGYLALGHLSANMNNPLNQYQQVGTQQVTISNSKLPCFPTNRVLIETQMTKN
jgi:hypothetical protein